MITDEMVKAANTEDNKWRYGSQHGRGPMIWNVTRDGVRISEHERLGAARDALADACTRAMLEAAERAAWLPIDTAPTDPSVAFLVTGHRWGDPAKGRFYDRACFFDGAFHGIDPATDEPDAEVTFSGLTHWRPEPTLEDFGEEA